MSDLHPADAAARAVSVAGERLGSVAPVAVSPATHATERTA